MYLLPGFDIGGSPDPVAAPAPLPTREDPAIAEAREKRRLSELRRKGRAATQIAPREDQLGTAPVVRPAARTSQNFGG